MAGDSETTIMFPLRTSVEFFRDPDSPVAAVRAKQGAILYDRLVFEEGLFDATISTDGSDSGWRPLGETTDEQLRQARVLHEEGQRYQVAFGKQPAKGVPAKDEDMHVMIDGSIVRHYVAEWESVRRELAPLEPDWVESFALPDYQLTQEQRRDISRLDVSRLGEAPPPTPGDAAMRTFTYKALHHDAVVAASFDAAFNVTSQFRPELEHMQAAPGLAGTDTDGRSVLEVWAPNLGALAWEQVLEFREHPGAADARAKLREIQAAAQDGEPADEATERALIGQEVTNTLTAVIEDLRPRFGLELVREALLTGVSTAVPIVGPVASVAAAAMESRRYRHSAHAALMILRPRAS